MRMFPALALAFGVSLPSPSTAQQDLDAAPSRRPGWLPRESRFDPSLTTAEKATILKRLNEIERLVLQIPELARPEGFEVWPSVNAAGFEIWPVIQGHPKGNYVVQSYQLWTFRPTKAIAGEGRSCLDIIVNPLPGTLFPNGALNALEDGKGDRLYSEHSFGAKIAGAMLAYAEKTFDLDEPIPPLKPVELSPKNQSWHNVFFSANGVSPWLEATREEYLEALIWNWETKDLKEVERGRQLLTKTRYQRWMEDAPKRKRERDEALAAVEKANPSQAAAARKEAEAIEREISEQLKAAEDEDRAENARELAQGMPADMPRAKLAEMTPAERAMPAWTDNRSGPIEFVQPNTWGAVRMVRANPAFYRSRSSRTLPRGVMVRFTALGDPCHALPVQRAFYAAYKNLDYAALRRLLEAEPR